jgi:hypothetical protein
LGTKVHDRLIPDPCRIANHFVGILGKFSPFEGNATPTAENPPQIRVGGSDLCTEAD